MKKAGWIATVAAGVVLVGGGAWAAATLAVSDEGTAAVVETAAPTPAASATPEATPTPTAEPTPEDTPTPTLEAVETPAPVEELAPVEETPQDPKPAPPLTEDQIFLQWANEWMAHYGMQMADADMLAALNRACGIVASGSEERAIPVELDNEYNDINTLFIGAARNGYFTDGNAPASYCD